MSKHETTKMFERDTTLTAHQLRSAGYIPATIYGKNFENLSIQIRAHEFELSCGRGCKSFTLEGMGKSLDVLVQQRQMNAVKGTTLHVEFLVPAKDAVPA